MTAVLLALASAALFGGMTIAVRVGLRDGGDAGGAALATVLVGARRRARRGDRSDTTCITSGRSSSPVCSRRARSQILFTLGVREIGASRTSVTVGAAPLVAVAIALVFLGEPLRIPLVVGALAVVAGGVLLAAERDRPGHLRARGLLFAAGAAALFATRDNVVRALHAAREPGDARLRRRSWRERSWRRCGHGVPPTRRELRRLAPAGVLFGLSYVCLFEAYWRGRVTVVSPLVATESLWGVALAALADPADRGDGAEARARRAADRRGRSRHRRNSLTQEDDDERRGGRHDSECAAPDAGEDEDRDEDAEVARGGSPLATRAVARPSRPPAGRSPCSIRSRNPATSSSSCAGPSSSRAARVASQLLLGLRIHAETIA